MLKIYAAKYSLIASAALTGLHFVGVGTRYAEDFVSEQFLKAKSGVVAEIAANAGYVPYSAPEPEVSNKDFLIATARAQGLDPAIALSLMHHESGNNPSAYSAKGAIGLLQIMPFNAKRCGLKSPAELLDDKKNITCGLQILAEELRNYRGNYDKALQVYNGGPNCIGKCRESLNHSASIRNNARLIKNILGDV